ncbi:MAG: hypothetical protein RR863_05190 [Erysipelotrichaceae bacterium]
MKIIKIRMLSLLLCLLICLPANCISANTTTFQISKEITQEESPESKKERILNEDMPMSKAVDKTYVMIGISFVSALTFIAFGSFVYKRHKLQQ